MFLGDKNKQSDLLIPWCTYTEPEVAHVGKYEAELTGAGVEFESYMVRLPYTLEVFWPSQLYTASPCILARARRMIRERTSVERIASWCCSLTPGRPCLIVDCRPRYLALVQGKEYYRGATLPRVCLVYPARCSFLAVLLS